MDEPEESAVLARQFGRHQFLLDGYFLAWLHRALEELVRGTQVVAVSLDEHGVLGPISLAIVAECPRLHKYLVGAHHVSVAEVFLHELRLAYHLLLVRLPLG